MVDMAIRTSGRGCGMVARASFKAHAGGGASHVEQLSRSSHALRIV
jgi:hypothetical protein